LLLGFCGCGRIVVVLGRRGGRERGVGDNKGLGIEKAFGNTLEWLFLDVQKARLMKRICRRGG